MYRSGKRAQHKKVARQNKDKLIKILYLGKGRTGKTQVNNTGVVKKGWSNMCAPAIVNLYIQTKVDLFPNIEETLSYGRQTLGNFQKFSMSIEPITLSPPRFAPLT